MTSLGRIPLKPDYPRPGVHIERAMIASMRAVLNGEERSAEKIARQTWAGDEITPAILKAASAPADTVTTGWAKELAPTLVGDFIGSLQPVSAASKLINAGLRITLDGFGSLNIPKRSTAKAATDVAWVQEGQPIPTKQYTINDAVLGPTHKLGLLVILSTELAEHGNGEAVITQLIREDVAASLDASLLSTTAADSTRPAGILNGVSALPAATASPNIVEAMVGDLSNIAGAIADNGGSGNVVYIASPKQAMSAKIRLLTQEQQTIWGCPALAAGTVIGVDPGAFVSAFGPEPRIDASREAAIEMRTDPAGIVSGSPGTVSAPVKSLWQTQCIAIRAIVYAAWTMRQPGMVAYVTGCNW